MGRCFGGVCALGRLLVGPDGSRGVSATLRPGVGLKIKIRVNGAEVEIDDPGKYLE